MMKILCIITRMGSGGAERQMAGLSEMLTEAGHDVRVRWFQGHDFYDLRGGKKIAAKSRAFKFVRFLLSVAVCRPDVVIAYLDRAARIACRVKTILPRSLRYRLIVSERNITTALDGQELEKFRLYEAADVVVANSQTQGAFIREHFPALAPKVKVITNFVDLEHFNVVPAPSGDDLRLLTVARVTPQKNTLEYIRAVKFAVDRGCRVVADWYGYPMDPAYADACSALVKELGIGGAFRFHPAEKDVRPLYMSADAFVLPSVYEGFPNVLGEAAACSLPILCTDVSDNGRFVGAGNGLLCAPSAESIADAICRLGSMSRQERLAMGALGRGFAEQSLSRRQFIEEYGSIL